MNEPDKNAPKRSHAVLFAIQLAIVVVLFLLDITLGPGISDGIGYSIVLVLCLRNPQLGYTLWWAGLSTALIVAGGIIMPDRDILHATLINRGLEICTVWVVWILIRAVAPRTSD